MSDAINSKTVGASPALGDQLSAGQRSRKRDSLFLAARMRAGDGGATDIRVRNLSEGGLMIDGAPPLALGTELVVELRNIGPVAGKVAWYIDGRAGVAFDVPIDPIKARKPVATRAASAPASRPARR